ncbi:MAG: tetratricopeptide repeat protein [Ardenticatenaceae bacterium]|nr:tetratricopeptide repeat protein [Ardenticatenaceae bacterium]
MFEIQLFGLATAQFKGTPLTFRSAKIRALLAYLAVNPGQPQRREFLATLLWGDAPDKQARSSLRVALNRLQQTLAPVLEADLMGERPLLEVTRQTVQLNLSPAWCSVDTAVFQEKLNQCRTWSPADWWRLAACIPHLETAVHLYHEDFLAGLHLDDSPEFEAWQLTLMERYYQQYVMALDALARHYLVLGYYDKALAYARRLLASEPWRELPHRLIMQTLAEMGQPEMALQQFRQCRRILAQELDAEPDEATVALAKQIETGHFHKRPLAPEIPTLFIGRTEELHWLKARLIDPTHRLLTLAGPGGIGKTRLALTAAEQIGHYFPDGVCFVSLADVGQPNEAENSLLAALAEALPMPVAEDPPLQEQVVSYLSKRELVIVLDNFEDVSTAVGLVLDLLAAAPHVTFLVTSRIRLDCQPEQVFHVKGLPIPPKTAGAAAPDYASTRLFLERARQRLPYFTPTATDLHHIVDLCRLTDGMPLALLLAASWVEEFSCAEIATAVRQNMRLLSKSTTGILPRQRNVQAVFEHSWQQLSTTEQAALARLSLFVAEFSREAALTVAEATPTMLTVLTAKCMIEAVGSGRYHFHPLLRHMAGEKLTALPETEAIAQTTFVAWYAQFLARLQADLNGSEQMAAVASIRPESANVRHVWQLALASANIADIEQLAFPLAAFYDDTAQYAAGLAHFEWAKQQLEIAAATETKVYAQVLLLLGMFLERMHRHKEAISVLQTMLSHTAVVNDWDLSGQGQFRLGCILMHEQESSQALASLQKAEQIFTRLEDEAMLAKIYLTQGGILRSLGQYTSARKKLAISLELRREIGNPRMLTIGLNGFGYLLIRMGEFTEAVSLLQESLELERQLGHQAGIVATLINLSLAYDHLEKWEAAESGLAEALDLTRALEDREGEAICLNNLGYAAVKQGFYEKAIPYLQESLRIKQENQAKVGIIFSTIHLGHAYIGLNQLETARSLLVEACSQAEALAQKPLWLSCQVALAQLCLAEGNRDEAVRLARLVQADEAAWEQSRRQASLLLQQIA